MKASYSPQNQTRNGVSRLRQTVLFGIQHCTCWGKTCLAPQSINVSFPPNWKRRIPKVKVHFVLVVRGTSSTETQTATALTISVMDVRIFIDHGGSPLRQQVRPDDLVMTTVMSAIDRWV